MLSTICDLHNEVCLYSRVNIIRMEELNKAPPPLKNTHQTLIYTYKYTIQVKLQQAQSQFKDM